MQDSPEDGGRCHMRVGYNAGTVTVRAAKSSPFIPASLLDISIGGCLISVPEPLPVSPSQVIELRIDLNSIAFRVLGFVRRVSNANHSIGVEFHKLSDKDKTDLEEFIHFFAAF